MSAPAISHLERGAGPALVLLHGIGAAAESWLPVLDRLAASGRRVLAWDAPGYGGSAPLSTDAPSAVDYAERLGRWLDECGVASCDLLGHSLGALIAAAFTARQPQRVRKLILASPAVGYGIAAGAPWPDAVRDRLHDLDTLGAAAMAAKRAARLCAPGAAAAAVAAVTRVMAKVSRPGYAQASRLLAGGDIAADLRRIAKPALILCGSADVITPPERSRALAEMLAGARYHEIADAGHAVYVEAPAAFATAVDGFLGAP